MDHRNNFFNQLNQAGRQPAAAREAPLRQPSEDELSLVMAMGFNVVLATAAIQMANYDIQRAIELLCSPGQEAQIYAFSGAQRALQEQEDQRQ